MLEKDFKIRCSKIHDIMTYSGLTDTEKKTVSEYLSKPKLTEIQRNKLTQLLNKRDNPILPQGAKTYAKKWLKDTRFKRRKEISNKYTDKGNINESDAVELVSRYFKKDLIGSYNTEYKSNEFLEGTCDINDDEFGIIDIKNSWSLDTFPMYESEIPDKKYIDQVRGYMELNKRKKGYVAYVLTDIPFFLLEKEIKWLYTDDEKQEVAYNYIYTLDTWLDAKEKYFPNAIDLNFIEVPRKDRVKVFEVSYCEEFKNNVEKRVKEIRIFIKSIVN